MSGELHQQMNEKKEKNREVSSLASSNHHHFQLLSVLEFTVGLKREEGKDPSLGLYVLVSCHQPLSQEEETFLLRSSSQLKVFFKP